MAGVWSVTRAENGGKVKPWGGRKPVLEHVRERKWVSKGPGRAFLVADPDNGRGGKVRVRDDVYWKLRAWWKGEWSVSGVEYIRELRGALLNLVSGARDGRHTRQTKMVWASHPSYGDIIRDIGGINGTACSDLRNLDPGFDWACMLEAPGGFVGGLRADESEICDTRVLRDGLRPEVFENNRVEANPEFDIGDARRENRLGMVGRVVELAETSDCSLLLFPLFRGAGYEGLIERAGGVIVFRAPPDTWSFIPDSYWGGGVCDGGGRYLKEHVMAVVAVGKSVKSGAETGRLLRVEASLRAWWASRAPPGEAEKYLRGCEDGGDKVPDWMAWWDPGRPREEGWAGWGRDARGGDGAFAQTTMWDGEIRGFGKPPPAFRVVLQQLGVAPAAAARLVVEVEGILTDATGEIWGQRCCRQRKVEREKGITEDKKRDNQAARRWRAERREEAEGASSDDEEGGQGESDGVEQYVF
jgi:hypothetical protein